MQVPSFFFALSAVSAARGSDPMTRSGGVRIVYSSAGSFSVLAIGTEPLGYLTISGSVERKLSIPACLELDNLELEIIELVSVPEVGNPIQLVISVRT